MPQIGRELIASMTFRTGKSVALLIRIKGCIGAMFVAGADVCMQR